MSGMANLRKQKGADEPHLFDEAPRMLAGVRARYSINDAPNAFAVS
jgi:hypothetical protein